MTIQGILDYICALGAPRDRRTHQLNINAHKIIVDLVDALNNALYENIDWVRAEKALAQAREFLGVDNENI